MPLIIGSRTEGLVDTIGVLRERLGDSGNIRNSVTPVLRRAARLGAHEARVAAPRGATGRLADAIADDAFEFRVRGDVATARFGVQPVPNPGRGSRLYPLYVHEGTGIHGRLGRVITAKRKPNMIFPDGGKPWPVSFTRLGLVKTASVSGQRAQPYMTRAFEVAQAEVEAQLDDMIRNIVD